MSLSMTRHSLDVMGPVWCILNVIFYWTSLCVILCTCRVSAVQHCLKNSTDGNRTCTLNGTCTDDGLPKLPDFPDVRLWPINTTRLVELVEPCLLKIITTTEQPSTAESTAGTSSVTGTDITTDSRTVKDTTTSPPTTPTPTAKPGPNALIIVVIVASCILAVLAILAGVYHCVRKKNETCKVHSESEQADGNSLKPAAQGPDSTDKEIDSSPAPPSGGGVVNTPHVPDPKESDESRNRTFSTGSRVGDTSILMPADPAGTSQAEPKKKKEKKKKKKEKKEKRVKRGTKDIELPPVQPKEQAYDQVKTADEVV